MPKSIVTWAMDCYSGGNMISNTQLNTIQKLQKKAIKFVDPTHNNIETVYKKLKVLKMKEILKIENCKMAHKLEHNKLPGKLPSLFNTDNIGRSLKKAHSYNTRTKKIPNLPRIHTKQYKDIFLCSCITDYQTVPTGLRQIWDTKKFTEKLKCLVLSR